MTYTYLTVSQAARTLGKGNDTIRRWFDAGQIDGYVTPFGERMISAASIDAIIANKPAGE